MLFIMPGGHSGEVIPVPIPNTEVKLSCADDTASCGKVGSCQAFSFFPLRTPLLIKYFRFLIDYFTSFLNNTEKYSSFYTFIFRRKESCYLLFIENLEKI